MTDGMQIDPGTLERLAGRLRQGASDVDGPAQAAPETPDAGVSTGPLAGAFGEIARGLLGLGTALDEIAGRVAQSHGDYREIDADNAAQLRGQQPN